MVWDPLYPPPFKEALDVNGLTVEELKRHGAHPTFAVKTAIEFMSRSDVLLAHNGNGFDYPVFDKFSSRYGMQSPKKMRLDSRTDFNFPERTTSRRLHHLAADHGVFVSKSHRALHDVLTMLEVVSHYDIESAIERAKSPLIEVQACPNDMKKNEELKKNRYRWNPEKKVWWKEIREIDFDFEKASVSFEIWKGQNGKKEDVS